MHAGSNKSSEYLDKWLLLVLIVFERPLSELYRIKTWGFQSQPDFREGLELLKYQLPV